jgi:hypothetical protein
MQPKVREVDDIDVGQQARAQLAAVGEAIGAFLSSSGIPRIT